MKYLNKSTNFKCSCSMLPIFLNANDNNNVKFNGSNALTNSTKLSGNFGACKNIPLGQSPSGGKCILNPMMQNWQNCSNNIDIRGKKLLTEKSCINCTMGGKISVNINNTNIDNNAQSININIPTITIKNDNKNISNNELNNSFESSSFEKKVLDSNESFSKSKDKSIYQYNTNPKEKNIPQHNDDNIDYICKCGGNFSKCPPQYRESCTYIKISNSVLNSDIGNNSEKLKKNLQEKFSGSNCKKCKFNEYCYNSVQMYTLHLTDGSTIDIIPTYHHLIPVKEAFSKHSILVKFANLVEYDINNANNGICLITNKGNISENTNTLYKSIEIMDELKTQLHRTHHSYKNMKNDISVMNTLDTFKHYFKINPFLAKAQFYDGSDYITNVEILLKRAEKKLENVYKNKCLMQLDINQLKTLFQNIMDILDKEIYTKLDSFKINPLYSAPYFVSKEVVEYSYNYYLKKRGLNL